MRTDEGTLFRRSVVAGAIALLATAGAAALESDEASRCVVTSIRTLALGIEVAVTNADAREQSGTVRVLALLEDGETFETEGTFAAQEGQTVFVPLGTPGPVRGVVDVGVILDDGPPFNF